MAQVGVQAPGNLMDMYRSASPMLWDIATQQVEDQRLGNELNRKQALQDMLFAQEDQPLALEAKQLSNQTSRAALPGVAAQTSVLQDKATLSRNTLPQQQTTEIAELAKKVTAAQLSEAESQVKSMRLSKDPAVRAQGDAMWARLQEVTLERDKIDRRGQWDMKQIGAQGANAMALEKQRIDAGKYARQQASTDFAGEVQSQLSRAKKASEKVAILTWAATAAEQAGELAAALQYRGQANALMPQMEFEAPKTQGTPGAVDISALSKNQIPTNPDKTMPRLPTQEPMAAPKGSFKSEDEVKSAVSSGKLKIGDIVIINGQRVRLAE